MRHLTRKASKAYFDLSRFSYIFDLVGWMHFLDRMSVLKDITRPKDPIHVRATRILEIEEWLQNDQWLDEPNEINTEESIRVIVQRKGEAFLFLVGIPGLQNWYFHQYDDDFFPSIPHGHWKGKKRQKLDSYLGWVYDGSKQTRREQRSLIIRLWNDEGFREFSATAVDYYMSHHPHYTGWRVSNPKRRPRKR